MFLPLLVEAVTLLATCIIFSRICIRKTTKTYYKVIFFFGKSSKRKSREIRAVPFQHTRP
jgi:hypothetical protein